MHGADTQCKCGRIIVKATKDSEAGVMPEERIVAAMARYHEGPQKAGALLDAAGLQMELPGQG